MSDDPGQTFIRESSYRKMPVSAQKQGQPQPPLELPYPEGAALIPLPDPDGLILTEISLREAIDRRRTVRKYGEAPITFEELSYLLWATQGVKAVTALPTTLRTVPSAGARHAIETFLVIKRVMGLERGLYRYIALHHALLELDSSAVHCDEILRAFVQQDHILKAAATLIWAAVPARMEFRHPVRGYRYLFLDAGHICQNLYLAAEMVNCGVCALGVFDDDVLNPLLGLDGQTIFAVYAAALGRRS